MPYRVSWGTCICGPYATTCHWARGRPLFSTGHAAIHNHETHSASNPFPLASVMCPKRGAVCFAFDPSWNSVPNNRSQRPLCYPYLCTPFRYVMPHAIVATLVPNAGVPLELPYNQKLVLGRAPNVPVTGRFLNPTSTAPHNHWTYLHTQTFGIHLR